IFLILVVSRLLYLHWNVPADTLDNSAGGIIGYELWQSLSQLLTIYGATLFLLVFGVVLFTLALGVQWSKTWVTLKAMPGYLLDLLYKNVSPNESAYDLTT
ncbi:DNA translocase FtsK 4TM domain-containing protein, partial [Acinetobacter baumannii]|uniref:DNA translocase FtsK 4TM domain-containing protein n=1 Tax=Acinetobacter baumannii TaxID=470 RepID=UPI003AF6E9FB